MVVQCQISQNSGWDDEDKGDKDQSLHYLAEFRPKENSMLKQEQQATVSYFFKRNIKF